MEKWSAMPSIREISSGVGDVCEYHNPRTRRLGHLGRVIDPGDDTYTVTQGSLAHLGQGTDIGCS